MYALRLLEGTAVARKASAVSVQSESGTPVFRVDSTADTACSSRSYHGTACKLLNPLPHRQRDSVEQYHTGILRSI